MAWLRSEQSLLHHPKTVHLKTLLGVDVWVVIGKLHMLWWWCLDYAIDGDLSKKEVKVIEDACQIPLKLLIKAGFVDSRPYRRIHSWWEVQGNYLRARFKDQPDKWNRIKQLYENDLPMSIHRSRRMSNTTHNPTDVDRGRTDVQTDVRTFKETRASAGLGLAAPPASLAGEVDDFNFGGTDKPQNQFELDHWEFKLNHVEKIQTKLREAWYGKVEVRK